MEQLETIYLYTGENQPNVKLTCIEQFNTLTDLTDFFHDLQETYNIEFESCQTITDNLKITCSSYGYDNPDKKKNLIPFYIVEYDNDEDSFYLWKTDGDWKQNKIFALLYKFYSKKTVAVNWEQFLLKDENFINSPIKNQLESALNKLNVDWSKIDINLFWKQFSLICNDRKDKDDFENINTLKTFISLAILKCNVILNQKLLAKNVKDFYQRLKGKFNKLPNNDIDSESQRESSQDTTLSKSTTTVISPVSPPSPSNSLYTYQKDLNNQHDTTETVANQIFNNFNNHFKLMAEDYEIFELKTKFDNAKSRSRSNSNSNQRKRKIKGKTSRISKIK